MSQLVWQDYDKDNPPVLGWYVLLVNYPDFPEYSPALVLGHYYEKYKYEQIRDWDKHCFVNGELISVTIEWVVDNYAITEHEYDYKILQYATVDNVPKEVMEQGKTFLEWLLENTTIRTDE